MYDIFIFFIVLIRSKYDIIEFKAPENEKDDPIINESCLKGNHFDEFQIVNENMALI